MTRINTNVTSLIAQNVLGRSNASLEQALTRLSTGLRINSGKDDPAGLIASENLRSDMTSLTRAIGNTERADQIVATADSALGQVSSLLNDIRGLITESANTGALSDDQIAANQLQIDSSLEALNRIAQTTSFQGRKLLDGSLDFNVAAGTNFNRISSLQIDQANLGATGQVAVSVAVSAAATQAEVDVTNIPAATAASPASTTWTATNAEVLSTAAISVDAGTVTVTAAAGYGDILNNISDVVINLGQGSASAVYANGVLTVGVTQAAGVATTAHVTAAIEAAAEFTAVETLAGADTISAPEALAATVALGVTGRDAGASVITITSVTAGASANGKTVLISESNDPTVTGAAPQASVDVNGNITVLIDDTDVTDLDAITSAIDALDDYTAVLNTTSGDGNYNPTTQVSAAVANTAGGVAASGGISQDLVFELAGANGSEVFSVLAGTSIANLVSQINLVSDATGVQAVANSTTLEIKSTAYGTDAFVDLSILSEGTGTVPAGTFTTAVGAGSRNEGTDIAAKVNGIDATGTGNKLSMNTSMLDLAMDVAAGFIGNMAFTITGGGALFQLGPEVVSNQQARIGITSVNTGALGGVSGKLFQVGTGGSADLTTDTATAADIVDEAINQVTTLRGRLGAFQRTLLETNKNAMNETLVNLTDAESSIRDADFASETAALTRAQILVQAGTTVLSIANSNPQNVLALLR